MTKCAGVYKIAAAAFTVGIMVVVTACGPGRDYDSPTGGPIEIERSPTQHKRNQPHRYRAE